FFLMIRRPPRSTRKESSAASDVYKRQRKTYPEVHLHYWQTACSMANTSHYSVLWCSMLFKIPGSYETA
ncbi:hypothetical protein, partial [Staphylococcus aureus]